MKLKTTLFLSLLGLVVGASHAFAVSCDGGAVYYNECKHTSCKPSPKLFCPQGQVVSCKDPAHPACAPRTQPPQSGLGSSQGVSAQSASGGGGTAAGVPCPPPKKDNIPSFQNPEAELKKYCESKPGCTGARATCSDLVPGNSTTAPFRRCTLVCKHK